MKKNGIYAIMFMVVVSAFAQAAEDQDFKHFSISINAAPSLQNSTDTSVPGENKISDKSYQYQANFINQPQDWKIGPFSQKVDYYSLRAFAYKHAYTDPETSTSGAPGVGSIEGIALLYGQRYLMSDKGYQGFGFGWYAGFAMITDIWVQKCCGPNPTTEKKGIPVVAGELFYKYNVTPNFYIEPGVTAAYDSKGNNPVNFIPAIIIGGAF